MAAQRILTNEQKQRRIEYNRQYRKSLTEDQKNRKREKDRLYRLRKKNENDAEHKQKAAKRNRAYRLRKKNAAIRSSTEIVVASTSSTSIVTDKLPSLSLTEDQKNQKREQDRLYRRCKNNENDLEPKQKAANRNRAYRLRKKNAAIRSSTEIVVASTSSTSIVTDKLPSLSLIEDQKNQIVFIRCD